VTTGEEKGKGKGGGGRLVSKRIRNQFCGDHKLKKYHWCNGRKGQIKKEKLRNEGQKD